MAVELGTGYVSVVPEWEGGSSAAVRALGGPGVGKQAGGGILQGISGALGPAALTGIGAVAAAGLAAGFAAFKIGDSFDAEFDKIRVGTGKTGDELEGLQTSFKDVLKGTATDFESAGTAIETVNRQLGLTGQPLEDLSKQLLDLSRITGTDLAGNVDAVTGLFNNFGVKAADQGDKLDELFRASQITGISVADLATEMSGAGAILRSSGLGFEDSAALLGGLAKNGLSAADVMPALSRSFKEAATKGKPADEVLESVFSRIKDAPNDVKAGQLALEAFGAKGGKMAELIRSGALSVADLSANIAGGTDTIAAASEDTADFSEKFEILKNRVLVGLEPLATRVFDAIGTGMENLGPIIDTLVGGIETLVSVFQTEGLEGIGRLIEEQAPVIGEKLLALGTSLYEWVQPQIEPLLGKLGELLGSLTTWILQEGVPLLAAGVAVLIPAITDWLIGEGGALETLLDKAPEFIGGVITWVKEDLGPALLDGGKEAGASLATGIWEGFKETIGSNFSPFGKGNVLHVPGTPWDFELAGGGMARAGEIGIVGERGPEVFVPGQTGMVIPNHRLGDLAASAVVPSGNVTLQVTQLPGEDVISAGMRRLKYHQQIRQMVSSR